MILKLMISIEDMRLNARGKVWRIQNIIKREDGQTLNELAFIFLFVVLGVIAALSLIGNELLAMLLDVTAAI